MSSDPSGAFEAPHEAIALPFGSAMRDVAVQSVVEPIVKVTVPVGDVRPDPKTTAL